MNKLEWQIGDRTILLGEKSLLMAVVNVTPDSFSDGGDFYSVDKAVLSALEMIEHGADILDIGGESTRPGAPAVSEEEELKRVIPVIEGIRKKDSSILISIDTTKAKVAEDALKAGANIVNDVSGFVREPNIAKVVAKYNAGAVLMHMRGDSSNMQELLDYDDLIKSLKSFFTEQISYAESVGVARKNIVLDPGIGFSKDLAQNLKLINRLTTFAELQQPLLLGTSRKSFIGKILNEDDAKKRVWGTAASIAIGIINGAHILRVHDVAEMKDVIRVSDAIRNESLVK